MGKEGRQRPDPGSDRKGSGSDRRIYPCHRGIRAGRSAAAPSDKYQLSIRWTGSGELGGVCHHKRAEREYHQVGPFQWPNLAYLGDFPATALCGGRADQLRLHHGQATGRNGAISEDESGGPLAQILPIPRNDVTDPDADPDEDTADPLAGLRSDIKKARGRALLTETVAAGWGEGKASAPQADWTARRLGPAPPEAMVQLRRQSFDAVLSSCGVPPSMFTDGAGTGQREALRRWHMNVCLPLAKILEQELSEKLEVDIRLTLDGYARDMVGRAQVVARLTGAGVNIDTALMAAGLSEAEN